MLACPVCHRELAADSMRCPACGSDASVWLARDDQVYGPYTVADLHRARAEGRLAETDMLMVGVRGRWQALAALMPELESALPRSADQPLPSPTGRAEEEEWSRTGRPESEAASSAPPRRLHPALPAVILALVLLALFVGPAIYRQRAQQARRSQRTVFVPSRPSQPARPPARPSTQTPPLRTGGG